MKNMYKKSAMTNRIVLRTLVLAFAVMVFAGGDLKGQETLTVYDGTYQNQYVPIYGNWCDANQKNQIIYPASMLADIYGGQISALTFYFASGASGAASSWNNNFKVLIGETSSSRFDSNEYINFTATTVFDGTITDSINTSTNQLTIHFSSPYTYNCGNLIIEVQHTKGTYSNAYFYGYNSSTYPTVYGYNSNSIPTTPNSRQNFIPKTTFTYTPERLDEGCNVGARASGLDYWLPVNMFYRQSFTQQIYTSAEIGGEGIIGSISFKYGYTNPFSMEGIKVYMKNTTKASFDNDSDIVLVSDADKVFDGTFSATGPGWVTINLDNPFHYTGNNLLVCFYNPNPMGGYSIGADYKFFYTETTNNTSISYYDDTGFEVYVIDISTIGSYTGNKGVYPYHPIVKFCKSPAPPTEQVCEDFSGYAGSGYTNSLGTDILPSGWTSAYRGDNSLRPHIYNGTVSGYNVASISPSGDNRIIMLAQNTPSEYQDAYLILPPLFNDNLVSVSFNAYRESSVNTLSFGYVTGDPFTTYQELQTFTLYHYSNSPAATSANSHYTVSLSGRNIPDNAQLAFKWHNSVASPWAAVFIDDICIDQNPPSSHSVTVSGSGVCLPGNTTLTASYTGFLSPRFSWSATPSSGAGLPSTLTTPSIIVTPESAGSYNYVCTVSEGAGGTSESGSTVINVNNAPTITVSSPITTCESYVISPNITNTSCGNITYEWNGTVTSEPTYSEIEDGTHTYTLNVHNRAYKQYDRIVQNGVPAIVVDSDVTKAVPLTDGIGSNSTAGSIVYNAAANLQRAIVVNGGERYDTPYGAGSREGFYIEGGVCSSTASVTVTKLNYPTVTDISAPTTVCDGNPLTLSAPTVTGEGVSSQGWQISANGSSFDSFSASSSVAYSQNNYYLRYQATNSCGTTYSNNVQIGVEKASVGTVSAIAAPATICIGKSAELSASATGNSGNMSYVWEGGSTTVSPTAETTYRVTATATTAVARCVDEVIKEVSVRVSMPSIDGISDGDKVWSGNANTTNWSTTNNWLTYNSSPARYSVASSIPSQYTNVFVVAYGDGCDIGSPKLTANSNAKNVTVASPKSLSLDSYILTLDGGLNNSGTFNNNTGTLKLVGNLNNTGTFNYNTGKVFFNGTNQSVVNSSSITLYDVYFDQPSVGTITAANGITVKNSATYNKGIVIGNMTFDSGAISSGASLSSYVDGQVTKKGNNTFVFPTGNNGVLGTLSATISNNTSAGVKVRFNNKSAGGHGFSNNAPDNYPIWWNENYMCSEDVTNRFDHVSNFEYWKLDGIAGSTSLSTMTLKVDANAATAHFHDGATSNGVNANINAAAHYDCWKNIGGTANVQNNGKTITVSGITSLVATRSTFDGIVSLGSKSGTVVLPIELTSFSAQCDGKSALVEWTTSTERNNDYFIIERSYDAINFKEIARVAGAGNSIEQLDYTYVDYGIHGGDNYYRLVQVDYDGTRTVSDVIVANCIEATDGEPDVLAYPNPFNEDITVVLDNFGDRQASIEVFDMLGKLLLVRKVEYPQNSYEMILKLGSLPSAAYNIRVSTADFVINRQVVKN